MTQFHGQGEYEWARGLSASDIAGTVSGVARVEFEKIILETKSPLYYQLYFFGDDHWVKDQLQQAQACGYQAVVVTVDTPYYSLRERDLRANYDPRTAGWRTVAEPPDRSRNPTLDWRKLEKIRGYTNLPLIIKGISAPADVKQAGKEKIDGVWISNHGGHCTDNSLSALESLVRLRPILKKSSLEVIFDGGVRRGSAVLTALLLGADVVALGRVEVPFMRPAHLSGDRTPLISVTQFVMLKMDKLGFAADIVVQLAPTCPFVKTVRLEESVKMVMDSDCECAVSLKRIEHEHPYRARKLSENNYFENFIQNINVEALHSRQELPELWCTTGDLTRANGICSTLTTARILRWGKNARASSSMTSKPSTSTG